jgi:hypothetical protein
MKKHAKRRSHMRRGREKKEVKVNMVNELCIQE